MSLAPAPINNSVRWISIWYFTIFPPSNLTDLLWIFSLVLPRSLSPLFLSLLDDRWAKQLSGPWVAANGKLYPASPRFMISHRYLLRWKSEIEKNGGWFRINWKDYRNWYYYSQPRPTAPDMVQMWRDEKKLSAVKCVNNGQFESIVFLQ